MYDFNNNYSCKIIHLESPSTNVMDGTCFFFIQSPLWNITQALKEIGLNWKMMRMLYLKKTSHNKMETKHNVQSSHKANCS